MQEGRVLCRHRKARHDYVILETLEAGLVLQGTEIKSLRAGKANLQDSFARVENGQVTLYHLHISPYDPGSRFNHDPLRPRTLLLHKKEILRLGGKVREGGVTLIPLDIHLSRGKAKLTLALARGKRAYDKREALRRQEAEREVARTLRRSRR